MLRSASLSNERRSSSQGARAKRDGSLKETTKKKVKSKIALKIKKSKERSKSPTSYTLSQENKMIMKRVQSPSKKPKVLSTNNSKINLLKGFLSNTLQKDLVQLTNTKSLLKRSGGNLQDSSAATSLQGTQKFNYQQHSSHNPDIININVPINIESMSSRYETQSSIPSLSTPQYNFVLSPTNILKSQALLDQNQTCKNNLNKHFVFIPDDISETEYKNRDRLSMGPILSPQFQNQKRISLVNLQQQLNLQHQQQQFIEGLSRNNVVPGAISSPKHLIDCSDRRDSITIPQKKIQLNLKRQKTPSRNNHKAQDRILRTEITPHQQLLQSQTFTSPSNNFNHGQSFQKINLLQGAVVAPNLQSPSQLSFNSPTHQVASNTQLYKNISEALEKQKQTQNSKVHNSGTKKSHSGIHMNPHSATASPSGQLKLHHQLKQNQINLQMQREQLELTQKFNVEAVQKQNVQQLWLQAQKQQLQQQQQHFLNRYVSDQMLLLSRQQDTDSQERMPNSKALQFQQPQISSPLHQISSHQSQPNFNTLGNQGTVLPPKSIQKQKPSSKRDSNLKQRPSTAGQGNFDVRSPQMAQAQQPLHNNFILSNEVNSRNSIHGQNYNTYAPSATAGGINQIQNSLQVKLDLKKYINF